MKTAVETIFVGKDRQYNRRFLQMCSLHLVEPVACTPASGWEKGQVENQVGLVRERFLTPRLRVKSYDELNAWLMDKSIAWAKAHPHPERPDRATGGRCWSVSAATPISMRYSSKSRPPDESGGLGLRDNGVSMLGQHRRHRHFGLEAIIAAHAANDTGIPAIADRASLVGAAGITGSTCPSPSSLSDLTFGPLISLVFFRFWRNATANDINNLSGKKTSSPTGC